MLDLSSLPFPLPIYLPIFLSVSTLRHVERRRAQARDVVFREKDGGRTGSIRVDDGLDEQNGRCDDRHDRSAKLRRRRRRSKILGTRKTTTTTTTTTTTN